jgi:hypothetical protein
VNIHFECSILRLVELIDISSLTRFAGLNPLLLLPYSFFPLC